MSKTSLAQYKWINIGDADDKRRIRASMSDSAFLKKAFGTLPRVNKVKYTQSARGCSHLLSLEKVQYNNNTHVLQSNDYGNQWKPFFNAFMYFRI